MFKKVSQNSINVYRKIWISYFNQSQSVPTLQSFSSATNSRNAIHHQTTPTNTLLQANKVLIVGAGLSGLSAAEHLIKHGIKDILILEAAKRYGGRIHTVKLGDAVCELGAKWINASDRPNSVFSIARQDGLVDRKSFENPQENFFIINKITMDEEVVQLASLLFRDMIKATERFLAEDAPRDQRTADSYLKDKMAKILARMPRNDAAVTDEVFKTLMKNLSCQLGSDLGYIHVKHLGIIARHFNQPIYLPTGLDQIFKQLVKNIPTERLLLGKPIQNIRWADLGPNESPHVICIDGSKYFGKHIICTIPLGALSVFSEHLFTPNLPKAKTNAIQNLGQGSLGKIYMLYEEPITTWFVGSLMIDGSQLGLSSRENWTAGISEIATLPDSRKVLEVKVGGRYNDIAERITEDELNRDITNTLRKVLRNNKIPRPKDMIRSFWSTDARSLCGLPFISIQSTESSVSDLTSPLGPKENGNISTLLFAGDATNLEGFGTVEAARSSGVREAQRILDVA